MKKTLLALLVLGAVIVLPGCGFDDGAGSTVTVVEITPTPEPTPTPETTPTPSTAPETKTPPASSEETAHSGTE